LALGLLATVVGLALLAACGGKDDGRVDARLDQSVGGSEFGNPDSTGKALPDVTFERADGSRATLADYAGQPLVVNVWSSTCAPCVKEMPEFEQVHQQVGDRVTFVGVNNGDSTDKMLEFAAKTGVTYDLLRDPRSELSAKLGIALMPATFFVSPDGKIVRQKTGTLDEEQLRAWIDELFPTA
jgi:peroxiredoxin